MSFSKKLKVLRATHGLTQQAMSEKLYLSTPVYNRYETGKKILLSTDSIIDRLTDVFGMPRDWLFEEDNSRSFETVDVLFTRETKSSSYNIPIEVMELINRQQELVNKILQIIR